MFKKIKFNNHYGTITVDTKTKIIVKKIKYLKTHLIILHSQSWTQIDNLIIKITQIVYNKSKIRK